MAIKHYKIGERCAGGVLSVSVQKSYVIVTQKEGDYSQGSRRSDCKIDQCKELDHIRVGIGDNNAHQKMMNFLEEITHYGIADDIVKWIESKITFKPTYGW